MTAENYHQVRIMHDSPAFGYVCLLGALDAISDTESISPQMYEWYDEECRRIIAEPSRRDSKEAFNTVLREVGGTMLRNVSWYAIESEVHL